MKTLQILKFPNPILTTKSTPVEESDRNSLEWVIPEMKRLMLESHGIGLAAPQVGISKRFFIIQINDEVIECINPRILEASDEKQSYREGCLSFPQLFNETKRPAKLMVEFEDVKGGKKIMELTGLDAVCFCHELDHLDGILFIDKAGPLRARLVQKYLSKK